jgi:hypothetical protein
LDCTITDIFQGASILKWDKLENSQTEGGSV